MPATVHNPRLRWLAVSIVLLLAACTRDAPVDPRLEPEARYQLAGNSEVDKALADMRRATARYHDVDAAVADGYQLVEECEVAPGGGSVGTVFANFALVDATIDPSRPEALLYDPGPDGELKLVGAELVVPMNLWTQEQPPELLGQTFGVEGPFYSLHIWIWRNNPDGMFAAANPRVSC